MKVFKFRLFPTKSQLSLMKRQLETHRLLYNECLEQKKTLWETDKKSLSCFDLIKSVVPKYRGECNYSSLQQTVRRLDKSYKAFFKQNSKFPRFKSNNRFNTIQYAKIGDGCKILDGQIYLQHIGKIKCITHRNLEGKPKTLSVTLKNNVLTVSIYCEIINSVIQLDAVKSVGIDFGIQSTITTSISEKFVSPKFTRAKEKDVARLSRRKNYKALNKVYTKIANKRKDFNHKLSRKIVNNHDYICLEDLRIESIKTKIKNINKRLYDIGISQLINFIIYKAENAGKRVVMVNPAYTSQTCSSCQKVEQKTLHQRQHECQCGLSIDRDVNAAINILRVGLNSLA